MWEGEIMIHSRLRSCFSFYFWCYLGLPKIKCMD